MLHRFAKFVAACTVLLVLAGSLVTSTASGLSVPDWPTTYGWNMFTFPPSKWVGGIFYEHGHRLIASSVGFLTIVLAAWLWRAGTAAMDALARRRRARRRRRAGRARRPDRPLLPAGSRSPPRTRASPKSSSASRSRSRSSPHRGGSRYAAHGHIGCAGPIDAASPRRHGDDDCSSTRRSSSAQPCGTRVPGLAIPDFPLMFGHLVPDHWDAKDRRPLRPPRRRRPRHARCHRDVRPRVVSPSRPPGADAAGDAHPRARRRASDARRATVLSRRDVWINSLHVVCGALVLTTSLVLTLRTWRVKFATPRIFTAERAERADQSPDGSASSAISPAPEARA